jgi:hypothetical protein
MAVENDFVNGPGTLPTLYQADLLNDLGLGKNMTNLIMRLEV